MCKAWEDEQTIVAILTTIQTARRYGGTEESILADIMEHFNLTKEEAISYMNEEITD